MRQSFIRSVAACGALALAATPSLATGEDLTIVSKMTIGTNTTTSTQYISEDKFRSADAEGGVIFNLKTGKMVVLDDKKKEYWETTQEELTAMMKQVDEQMKAMAPMLEKMGGKMVEVTVAKGTAPKKVAGYDTEHWVLSMGDSTKFEIWAAPGLKPPPQYFDSFKARYATMGPMAKRFEKLYDEMKKINGFPLATQTTVTMMMMKQETKSEATEVKKGAIPASAFQVPADYNKKDSPLKSLPTGPKKS